jgi:hypothetical protein
VRRVIAVRVFPARKFVGAAGVVLLHVGLIAALLNAFHNPLSPIASSREHIVWFTLAPKLLPAEKTKIAPKQRERIISTPFRYPDYSKINLPPTQGETDLGALHGFLFDCAPENLSNLTPEQRAHCATAHTGHKPDDSVNYADHTDRSKNAVRWARGLMRKQQPLLLPCMPPSLATLICLGKGAADGGIDLDAQPGYGDKPQDVHVPNNGDPPDSPPG